MHLKASARYRSQQVGFIYNALEGSTAYAVAEHLLRDSAIFLTRPGLPRGCMTIQTALAASDENGVYGTDAPTPVTEDRDGYGTHRFSG